MSNWMQVLAQHYDQMRRRYPDDSLLILFDIDGTIIDMRHLVRHVLRRYDAIHGTGYFASLDVDHITVHENHVEDLLEQLAVPEGRRPDIMRFWLEERWSRDSLLEAHHPFKGVMDVIRWFQMQPGVEVGLNTGRPESLRADTLRSLNELGREFRVGFRDDLLRMNQRGWEDDTSGSKADAIRQFQNDGHRVFAMVDNEPANLAAVAELDGCQDVLPLHAHTIFEGDCRELPARSASGTDFELTELATEDHVPAGIQYVWHGVNDRDNLRQFLGSDIEWGELDVRSDPETGEFVLHHDILESRNGETHNGDHVEELLTFDEVIAELRRFDKAIKVDLKEGSEAVTFVLEELAERDFAESRIWFNANIEVLGAKGFRQLRRARPKAIVQCPIDHLISQIIDCPGTARSTLEKLKSWGVSRFSIEWGPSELRDVVDRLGTWGFEVNLYNVPDLDAFLHAVLLSPRSVTADFNFPEWHYYGRGAGKNGQYYHYSVEDEAAAAA